MDFDKEKQIHNHLQKQIKYEWVKFGGGVCCEENKEIKLNVNFDRVKLLITTTRGKNAWSKGTTIVQTNVLINNYLREGFLFANDFINIERDSFWKINQTNF